MGLLPPILVELKASAGELKSTLGEAHTELDKLATKGATTGEKFKAGLKAGFVGAGAAFSALGGVLTTEGIKGTEATVKLDTAIKNAGGSMEDFEPKIHHVAGAMADFGHSQADTETALARLTDATGDPAKALEQMGLVADIAARKHISLADAADLVGKVDVGKGAKALTQFGVVAEKSEDQVKLLSAATKAHESAVEGQSKAQEKLSDLMERLKGKTHLTVAETQALRHAHEDVDAATKKVTDTTTALAAAQTAANTSTDDVAKNLENLHKKVMGGAAAQADTLGGKINSLKAHMENLAEAAGKKVGPALAVAGPIMAGLGPILTSNLIPNLAKSVVSEEGWAASTVGSAVTAAAGWVASMAAMVASSIASAAAMIAPFLPLILTVAAIGIAAWELYQHWDEVWGFIKGVVVGVFNWLKDNWPLVLAILTGPIGLAVLAIVDHWDKIKNGFTAVKDWIADRVGDIVGFFTGLPGRLVSATGDLFRFVRDAIVAAKDWVWDRLVDIVGFYTGLPGRLLSAAGDLFGFVRDKIVAARDWVHDRAWDIIHFFETVPGLLASAGAHMWDWIGGTFKSVINTVIGWWNDLSFTTPHFSIGPIDTPSLTIHTPRIPPLEAGGLVTSGGLAWLHAAEVVSPAPTGSGNGTAAGTTNITYQIDVSVPVGTDLATAGAAFVSAIKDYETKNGHGWRA